MPDDGLFRLGKELTRVLDEVMSWKNIGDFVERI